MPYFSTPFVNGFVWSNKATIWMKSHSMIWFLVTEYHSLFWIAKYDIWNAAFADFLHQ
jgi:hypothetical protein